MKRKLLVLAFAVVFVGCVPTPSVVEWNSNPDYRAYTATRLAEAVMETPSVIVPDEEEVEELCDGSGWIVHGDGHKTPCPGCEACEKKTETSVIVTEIPVIVQDEPQKCENPVQRRGLLNRLFNRR